jgi:hypothetical protein
VLSAPSIVRIISQMAERELTRWLDALAEAGLIGEWQWDFEVVTGNPGSVQYWIDGRHYTHEDAVRLVRERPPPNFRNSRRTPLYGAATRII